MNDTEEYPTVSTQSAVTCSLQTLSFNIHAFLKMFSCICSTGGLCLLKRFPSCLCSSMYCDIPVAMANICVLGKRGLEKKKFNVNGQIPKQTGLQASVQPAPSLFLSQLFNGLCARPWANVHNGNRRAHLFASHRVGTLRLHSLQVTELQVM